MLICEERMLPFLNPLYVSLNVMNVGLDVVQGML